MRHYLDLCYKMFKKGKSYYGVGASAPDNTLVCGGSTWEGSNTAIERASSLPKASSLFCTDIAKRIAKVEEPAGLIQILEFMDSEGINFTGSFDRVWLARRMKEMLEFDIRVLTPLNKESRARVMSMDAQIYTRCCGLRKKVCELFGVPYLEE